MIASVKDALYPILGPLFLFALTIGVIYFAWRFVKGYAKGKS